MSAPMNRVVRVRPKITFHRGRLRVVRYEATFYHSGYGMGWVSAFTAQKCQRRLSRLAGEMMYG